MILGYSINDNGSISIENIDTIYEHSGKRYTTYYFMSLNEAKRKHRKEQDLQNVIVKWVKLGGN